MVTPATVGVLALQGDYLDHERALHASGLETRRVRRSEHLEGLDGLVLPGGESTTMLRLLDVQGLETALGDALRSGLPTLATCAGLILCARQVREPEQRSFGVLDLEVARNGYGRQIHSGTFDLDGGSPMRGIFIRAPRVLAVGADCEVLARRGGDPVLVRQGNVLGACFHPELESGHPVSEMFAQMVRGTRSAQPAGRSRPREPQVAEADA